MPNEKFKDQYLTENEDDFYMTFGKNKKLEKIGKKQSSKDKRKTSLLSNDSSKIERISRRQLIYQLDMPKDIKFIIYYVIVLLV